MNITSGVSIGADHAGFEAKQYIIKAFESQGLVFNDEGTYSSDSVDYPDFAHKVAARISENPSQFGVLICGSGNGVCITANRHANVRAALCWTVEIAKLARQHNNANIICIPSRFVSDETAAEMVRVFLETPFEGGRHQRRMEKIEI